VRWHWIFWLSIEENSWGKKNERSEITRFSLFLTNWKAITGNISDSTEDLSGSESTTALSNSSKTAQSGHNSDSGNSTENSVASTESVLSLHPDDLDFDEKCTSALAKNIVKSNNSQCILAVKEYARDKLVQAVNGYKVNTWFPYFCRWYLTLQRVIIQNRIFFKKFSKHFYVNSSIKLSQRWIKCSGTF
jgi:hypothetical protein